MQAEKWEWSADLKDVLNLHRVKEGVTYSRLQCIIRGKKKKETISFSYSASAAAGMSNADLTLEIWRRSIPHNAYKYVIQMVQFAPQNLGSDQGT